MNAYKSFEVFTTEMHMTGKMHLRILRGIFCLHLCLALVLLILAFLNLSTIEVEMLQQIVSQHVLTFRAFNLSAALVHSLQLPTFASLQTQLYLTLVVYLGWPGLVFLFHRRTRRRFKRKTVRGSTLISEAELRRRLNTTGPSLQLTDNLSVASAFETRQFLISGAPGTGKTTLISGVIADLKAKGAKALVYDAKAGEFVARFYNPETDLIYNPFDARSVHWNFFEMLQSRRSMVTDFDTIAAAIIPEERSTQAQFFVDTARKILSSVLQYCYATGQHSIRQTAEFLSAPNLHQRLLSALEQIDGTLCAIIRNPGSGQTQGVLSVLGQNVRILNYMVAQPEQTQLSLHEWLTNDQPGLIFLPNAADQKETLKGVYSFFINSLATVLLSLRDDPDRRIFFLLDEFSTLERMESILELVKLGRSKGAAFFIGIQTKSQLDHLYGEHLANSLLDHMNNFVLFRNNENYTAKYMSDLLGEAESEAIESSYSAGYRESRDSESYHRSNSLGRLVIPSQIQSLPDLHFYLKLHGLPVAQCSLTYQSYPDVAEAFVPNEYFLSRNLQLKNTRQHGENRGSKTQNANNLEQQELPLDSSRVKSHDQQQTPDERDYPIDDFKF